MSSIVSSTDWIKQALPCGYSYCVARALRFFRRAVVVIIARARILPDTVLMVEADVEPNRAVERSVLIEAEPGQFVVENLGGFCVGEIAVGQAAIGDRAGDAMDQLPDGSLAPAVMRIGSVRDVAVKVFRDRDLGRERAPAFRHLDILLFENHLAAVVGDLRRPAFPLHFIEGRNRRVAEDTLKTQTATFLAGSFPLAGKRFAIFSERGGLKAGFELDHFGLGGSGCGE